MIFDCVGGVLLVEVGGCGWKALRRVLSRASLVVLDRTCHGGCLPFWVLPVSPFRALGFLGVSLVVFDRVCLWGVLLMVLDCGCCWEVSQRVSCGMSLGVFDRGFGWEVLCWEVLRGTWLVVCYGMDFLVLWVSYIRSRMLQIQ